MEIWGLLYDLAHGEAVMIFSIALVGTSDSLVLAATGTTLHLN